MWLNYSVVLLDGIVIRVQGLTIVMTPYPLIGDVGWSLKVGNKWLHYSHDRIIPGLEF